MRVREEGSCVSAPAGRWVGGEEGLCPKHPIQGMILPKDQTPTTFRLALAKVVSVCEMLDESSWIDSCTWVGLRRVSDLTPPQNYQRTSRMSQSHKLW